MPTVEPSTMAQQNPAYDPPDPMYAEIDSMPVGTMLPFKPDPNLRLGLQDPQAYRGSSDSGLYSMPLEPDTLAGHGALEGGASIMRISNSSLSRSVENQAPVMTPMTQDEIDALYAKPHKVRKPDTNFNIIAPVSKNVEHYIPPPLATGSCSNSQNNLYSSIAVPPEHDISISEVYLTDNTHTASHSSLNASHGTIETDV